MLDLLVVAQGEHKRLGITLTVSQQEQPGGKKAFLTPLRRKNWSFSAGLSPVHLALLDDHFVGFLSHDAAMKPHLCPVDHWKRQTRVLPR